MLFHICRSIRNTSETLLYKGEFADDVMLFANSRGAACSAIEACIEVTGSLSLTVRFPQTKFMAVGTIVSTDDQQPLSVSGSLIEWVDLFLYLELGIY